MLDGEVHHVELGEPVDVLERERLSPFVLVDAHEGEVGVWQPFYPVVGGEVQPVVLPVGDMGHEEVMRLLCGDVRECCQHPYLFEFVHFVVVLGVAVGIMEDEPELVVRLGVVEPCRVPVGEGHLFVFRALHESLQLALEVGDELFRRAPRQRVALLLREVAERDGSCEVFVDEHSLVVVDDLPVVEPQRLDLGRLHELQQVLWVCHPPAFVRVQGLFFLFLLQFGDHAHGVVDDRDLVGHVKALHRVLAVLVGDHFQCALVVHPYGVDDDVTSLLGVGDMVERGHRVVDGQPVGLHVHHHRRQFHFFRRQVLLHFLDVLRHMVEDPGLLSVGQCVVVDVRGRRVFVVPMYGEFPSLQFYGVPPGEFHLLDAVFAHHLPEFLVCHLHPRFLEDAVDGLLCEPVAFLPGHLLEGDVHHVGALDGGDVGQPVVRVLHDLVIVGQGYRVELSFVHEGEEFCPKVRLVFVRALFWELSGFVHFDARLAFEQVVDPVEQEDLVIRDDVVGREGVPLGVRDAEVVFLNLNGGDLVGVARLLPSFEPHGEVGVRHQRRLVDVGRLHVVQQPHPRLEHMGRLQCLLEVRHLDVRPLLGQRDVILPAVGVELVDAQFPVLEVDLPLVSHAELHLREGGDEVHEFLVLHEFEELPSHLRQFRFHPFAVQLYE